MEEIQLQLEDAKEQMEKALHHTEIQLSKIRAGKAMPNMLDGVQAEYYGTPTPINQMASINTPDARTLVIKPFEKKLIPDIEKAIRDSDLGLNPQNDGEVVRINIPPLTEERRISLVKNAKSEAEEGKIQIRQIRKNSNDELKKLLKEGAAEDVIKKAEQDIQSLTDSFTEKIDNALEKKEEEIMKI